jgi:hypothetical protein
MFRIHFGCTGGSSTSCRQGGRYVDSSTEPYRIGSLQKTWDRFTLDKRNEQLGRRDMKRGLVQVDNKQSKRSYSRLVVVVVVVVEESW